MRWSLAALLMGVGCGLDAPISSPPVEGQETAIAIVGQVYGRELPRIPITWIPAEYLDCAGGEGWTDKDGDCVSGELVRDTWGDPVVMRLAAAKSLSASWLAHEYCHVVFGDRGHAKDCPADNSGIIGEAMAALASAFPTPPGP